MKFLILDSISGVHVADTSLPLCQECFDKFNTFDELSTKATEVKEELNRLIQGASEIVQVKIEPKAEAYDYDNDNDLEEDYLEDSSRPEVTFFEMPHKQDLEVSKPQRARIFMCDLCPKAFPENFMLTRHKKIHSVDRQKPPKPAEFKCKVCDKTFPEQFRLNRHKQIHLADRPRPAKAREPKFKVFNCELCQKGFPEKFQLNR